MRLLVLSILVLTACSQGKPANASMGGISGGGGNVMVSSAPTHPTDAETVEHIVERLKPSVLSYLNFKEWAFRNHQLPVEEMAVLTPLFSSIANVALALEGIGLRVDDRQPCFDSQGVGFDGSSVTKDQRSVCVSAKRISEKVNDSEVVSQASALLVHEFSEKLGLSDAEAIQIQRLTLTDLSR